MRGGFRPKRFDVAGAHPDEAWRAVSDAAQAVKEMQAQAGGVYVNVEFWLDSKPLRFGNASDAAVQRFLARGVGLMDGLKEKLPLGMSAGQAQVRNRCEELAKSMKKVLKRRPDEPEPFDPWRQVKIRAEAGKDARTSIKTQEKYRVAMRGCFPRGPAQAQRSRAVYRVWEHEAERLGNNPPVPDAAKPWQRFLGVIDGMKQRDQERGIAWGHVDDDGIDFRPALPPRQSFRQRPRMRM